MSNPKIQVFAILRIDVGDGTIPVAEAHLHVSATKIVPTEVEADAEVLRLNALNHDRGVRYFWQATRYFPDGIHARST